MGQNGTAAGAAATTRRDRLIKERIHDPYHTRHKPTDGTRCDSCDLVFQGGAWRRDGAATTGQSATCPACRRIQDRLPAGEVTLSGAFLGTHRDEILNLAHNAAQREGENHPLHRIMDIEEQGKAMVITTTDIHLPRLIGQSLQRAYSGSLDIAYGDESYSIRVAWSRED